MALSVANDLAEIPRVAQAVERLCGKHGLPARTVHRFNLALEEVLTNVIDYAFPDGGRHVINVEIVHNAGILRASVSDDGIAFDPLKREAPDLRAPIEQRPIGGLGIHLVRQISGTASYRRENGRNVLTFSILPPAS